MICFPFFQFFHGNPLCQFKLMLLNLLCFDLIKGVSSSLFRHLSLQLDVRCCQSGLQHFLRDYYKSSPRWFIVGGTKILYARAG
jgi:hypothetical protein